MNKLLEKCPICSGKFFIKSVECKSCKTQLNGEFLLPAKQPYDEEILNFIKIFIHTEGNIRQTEKILNCSYPKVKNLLKKSKIALGVEEVMVKNEISESLDLLESGQISVDEVLDRINGLKK